MCARLPFLRVCQRKKTLLWSLWCLCILLAQWLSLWFFRCFPPDLTQILYLYGNRILYLSLHTEIECQRMFNLYSFVVALFNIVSSFNMEHFNSCLLSSTLSSYICRDWSLFFVFNVIVVRQSQSAWACTKIFIL